VATTTNLMIEGMEPGEVFDKLMQKGISKADAATIVGEWMVKYYGRGERKFTYSQPVAATDAGCVNAFQQQFHHLDWVDGVSVVQAGKTPGEDGFNDRLHRVEDDLESLGKEVTKAFHCSTALRAQVSKALEEVKNELNRLNQDVWELHQLVDRVPGVVGKIDTGKFLGVTNFLGRNVSVWQTADGYYTLPAVQTLGVGGGPTVDPQVDAAGNLAKFIHSKPEVRDAFGGHVKVKDFAETFGKERIDDGPTIAELVKILPAEAEYDSLDAMVKDAAERNAAVIRATDTADAAIASTFTDLGAGVETVGEAPIERLSVIPADVRTALVAAGVDTVAKLADVDPTELSDDLGGAGVSVTAADAADWKGLAMTLNGVR
jgi:hypothetical protein